MKNKYYNGNNIRSKHCTYNVIFGERSNGKTFDVLKYGFQKFIDSGEVDQIAIIRRVDEDFIGPKSARSYYDALMQDGNGENQIEIMSNGKYNGVMYWGKTYFLTKLDEDGNTVKTDKVIAYAYSLSGMEHSKGGQSPSITTAFFDEFVTRGFYLRDEFILFQNVLSTIIRDRDDVEIFMCGNTVNKYCPHFKEMGLYRIPKMQQGDIDVYTYGNSGLTVAVEFADSPNKNGKKSDKYFAFDNPRLQMITKGVWEIDIYPHCPVKYQPKDILFTYFILFEGAILQCEVIEHSDLYFTFIHEKTTPLKDVENDLIYSLEYSPRPNYRRNILKPSSKLEKSILWFFVFDKVFYQDNDVGELVRNFLQQCKTEGK